MMAEIKTDHLTEEERKILARSNAATEGPWYRRWPTLHGQDAIVGLYQEEYAENIITCDSGHYGPRPADAEFIIHARSDIPKLLETIEALRKLVAQLQEGKR